MFMTNESARDQENDVEITCFVHIDVILCMISLELWKRHVIIMVYFKIYKENSDIDLTIKKSKERQ